MENVSIEEKLKLQVANIEVMLNEHRSGKDMSNIMFWQMEHLKEVLSAVEMVTGADKVRKEYEALDDV